MTKRKATTASKPARGRRIASKAQRASANIIRSSKPSRVHSVAANPINSSPKGHNGPKQPQTPLVESPAMAVQDSLKQTMREPELKKGFDPFSATATVRAYQAKLLEIAQANMQFALESGQRLARIKSPVELLRALEELTKERIAMFRKYSNELVELSMKR